MNLIKFAFIFLLSISQVSYTSEFEEERTPSEIVFSIGERTEQIIEDFIKFMAPYATRKDIESLFSLRLINHFITNIFDSVFFKVNAKNKNQITRSLMNALQSTEEQLLLGENVELYGKMRPVGVMSYVTLAEVIGGSSLVPYASNKSGLSFFFKNKETTIATAMVFVPIIGFLLSERERRSMGEAALNIKDSLFNHFKKLNYALSKNQFNQIFEQASIFFKKLILEKYVENLLYKKITVKQGIEEEEISSNIARSGRLAPMFEHDQQDREDTIIIGHPFFGSIVFELKTVLDFKELMRFSFVKINKEDSTFLDVSLLPDWLLVSDYIHVQTDLEWDENYDFQQDIEVFDNFLNELQLNQNTKFLFIDRRENTPDRFSVSLFSLINLLDRISKKSKLYISLPFRGEIHELFTGNINMFPESNEFVRRYFEPIIEELKKHIVITK